MLNNKVKLTLFIGGSLFLFSLLFRYTPYLIPLSQADIARQRFHSVKFYDRNGELLQEVLSQNSTRSVYVKREKVSPYFIDAIIAAEDKNFYRHKGIDSWAVLRAAWQNIRSGEIVSGASTITLQLSRMIDPASRTILNKIQEAYRAYRMEAGMDKDAILAEYINRLPMGGNLYGIESAARTYFGISSNDLTLTQATFLAAIPNAPNRLNPYHNLTEIKHRQKLILERMVGLGMIPDKRVAGVLKEKVLLKPQKANFLAPHFVFNLMENLPNKSQMVLTTIDNNLQKMVARQISEVLSNLKFYHVTNAAVLLVDNHTGDVLAYAGSADYFNYDHSGQVDGIRALRQPGSTLKPFLYLLAMEEGFHPATLISDLPTHYRMPEGVYSPKNYSESFHGPVRLREALANSLNVPAVRTLAKIGVDKFLTRLREYRFDSLGETADHYGVGLALGGAEVSLYELTRAYSCLARSGNFHSLREISKLDGKRFSSSSGNRKISLDQYNYLIAHILSDHYARTSEFGFRSVLNLPFPCAVKTGTSFRFCDNWTVGYTTDFTLGVWVGNFDHSPMMRVSGITGAGPLFAKIMLMLYSDTEYPEKFPQPEGISRISICPLSGQKAGPHCPTKLSEFIPERDFKKISATMCDMHTGKIGESTTLIPVKYRDWADELGFSIKYPEMPQKNLQIVHPKNGAIYQRLPNLAPAYQSIRIQLECSAPQESIDWYLNNQHIKTTRFDHQFLWPSQPGVFELKAVAKNADHLTSLVKFEVK
jgi:penicillin-binding protein 1C